MPHLHAHTFILCASLLTLLTYVAAVQAEALHLDPVLNQDVPTSPLPQSVSPPPGQSASSSSDPGETSLPVESPTQTPTPVLPSVSPLSLESASPSVTPFVSFPSSPSPDVTDGTSVSPSALFNQSSPTPSLVPDAAQSSDPSTPLSSPSLSPESATSDGTKDGPQSSGPEGNSSSSSVAPETADTLSRTALLAISAAGAAALIIALALIVFIVRRRRPSEGGSAAESDPYYRFSPDDVPAPQVDINSTVVNVSNPGGDVQDFSGNPSPSVSSTFPPPLPPPLPPRQQGLASIDAHVPMVDSVGPHDATAPSPSQFTRRDSAASSGSGGTIVAPLYATVSVATSAAAPWFHSSTADDANDNHPPK